MATYVYASSQGPRTHSARTNFYSSFILNLHLTSLLTQSLLKVCKVLLLTDLTAQETVGNHFGVGAGNFKYSYTVKKNAIPKSSQEPDRPALHLIILHKPFCWLLQRRPMPTQICQPHSATPVRESY